MFARRLRLALLAATFAVPVMAQTTQVAPPPVTNPIPGVMKPGTPSAPLAAKPTTPAPMAVTKPAVPAPAASAATTPAPAAATGGRIDINSATAAQLDALPGVGPARAKKIIEGRPYTSLDELVTKKTLSKGVFEGAKGQMALANINTSSAAELAKTLPGIGEVRSKAIVAGRPYATPADLVSKSVLTQNQFNAIAGLISN